MCEKHAYDNAPPHTKLPSWYSGRRGGYIVQTPSGVCVCGKAPTTYLQSHHFRLCAVLEACVSEKTWVLGKKSAGTFPPRGVLGLASRTVHVSHATYLYTTRLLLLYGLCIVVKLVVAVFKGSLCCRFFSRGKVPRRK